MESNSRNSSPLYCVLFPFLETSLYLVVNTSLLTGGLFYQLVCLVLSTKASRHKSEFSMFCFLSSLIFTFYFLSTHQKVHENYLTL